jgi:hypothetical protein
MMGIEISYYTPAPLNKIVERKRRHWFFFKDHLCIERSKDQYRVRIKLFDRDMTQSWGIFKNQQDLQEAAKKVRPFIGAQDLVIRLDESARLRLSSDPWVHQSFVDMIEELFPPTKELGPYR